MKVGNKGVNKFHVAFMNHNLYVIPPRPAPFTLYVPIHTLCVPLMAAASAAPEPTAPAPVNRCVGRRSFPVACVEGERGDVWTRTRTKLVHSPSTTIQVREGNMNTVIHTTRPLVHIMVLSLYHYHPGGNITTLVHTMVHPGLHNLWFTLWSTLVHTHYPWFTPT